MMLLRRDEAARLAAAMLIEAGCVGFNAREPFTHASGRRAPTYIDCRRVISFPRIRATLVDMLVGAVAREAGFEAFDAVAGGETAGIPFAALAAERLGLPMLYVRKEPKGHGRQSRVEGVLAPGQRVLLIEDLATDGGSKISFAEALRAAGADCRHAGVIFAYGIFPQTEARLAAAGLSLWSLCSWSDVLAEAWARRAFDEDTLAAVESYLRDPEGWAPPG